MSRKIIYSPGYGAGWTTWNEGDVARFILTYQPIIDFLESGGKFTGEDHPLLQQLQLECQEKFGAVHVCVLGADALKVATVNNRVRIHEYDGSEYYEEEGTYDNWM